MLASCVQDRRDPYRISHAVEEKRWLGLFDRNASDPRARPSLVIGPELSTALMVPAASFLTRLLQTYRWIDFVGLAIIFYVALETIYRGIAEV